MKRLVSRTTWISFFAIAMAYLAAAIVIYTTIIWYGRLDSSGSTL